MDARQKNPRLPVKAQLWHINDGQSQAQTSIDLNGRRASFLSQVKEDLAGLETSNNNTEQSPKSTRSLSVASQDSTEYFFFSFSTGGHVKGNAKRDDTPGKTQESPSRRKSSVDHAHVSRASSASSSLFFSINIIASCKRWTARVKSSVSSWLRYQVHCNAISISRLCTFIC